MNQTDAFRETVKIAEQRGMPEMPGSELGLHHLRTMLTTVNTSKFSEAKLGRWLGWAQGACLWAPSWFVSTVGGASLEVVRRYVENQKLAAVRKTKAA